MGSLFDVIILQTEPGVLVYDRGTPKKVISGGIKIKSYKMPLSLGSKASLRPSPTILKANTTSIIAIPGAKDKIGLVKINL